MHTQPLRLSTLHQPPPHNTTSNPQPNQSTIYRRNYIPVNIQNKRDDDDDDIVLPIQQAHNGLHPPHQPTIAIVEKSTNTHSNNNGRHKVQPPITQLTVPKPINDSDDSDDELRRRRARAITAQRPQPSTNDNIIESNNNNNIDGAEIESNDSDESSSDDDIEPIQHIRPKFISQAEREHLSTQSIHTSTSNLIHSDNDTHESKNELRQNTIDRLTAADGPGNDITITDQSTNQLPSDIDYINDNDELNLWKQRELYRYQRDHNKLPSIDNNNNKSTKQYNSVDNSNEKSHGQHKFMQRYAHRGAFTAFIDDELLSTHNYDQATGVDNLVPGFDISTLPSAMQIRQDKIGMKGRSKYTHLVDQDTSKHSIDRQLK